MRAPAFWQRDGLLARLLAPASCLSARITARRVARAGWRAPVPVLCVGNVGLGGAGKTIVALDLGARLVARGRRPHFLLRGYGGSLRGPLRVTPSHTAAEVGDEAKLLAEVAPAWISADRAAGARAAVAGGAGAIVMDDGLQNPTLAKTLSLLVVDGAAGFGNGRVFPAGPLREPVAAGAARCAAAVLIGEDRAGVAALLPPALPVLRARLVPGEGMRALAGRRVLAFAGIGHPEKFFASLAGAGAVLAAARSFADHHRFTAAELDGLLTEASALGAEPVTTAKDAVRLPPGVRARVAVADIGLAWEDEAALAALLDRLAA
jgi:tetraacyldisaccharide 4'-kinase